MFVVMVIRFCLTDSGHEWIAHDWLTKWTDPDIDRVPPIDNEAVLCQHSKFVVYISVKIFHDTLLYI